jgi:hypothetical protein
MTTPFAFAGADGNVKRFEARSGALASSDGLD